MSSLFRLTSFCLLLLLLSVNCSGSLLHAKPKSDALNHAMTALWARDIRRVAQSGDWILTRSYSKTGDAIVGITLGESFSHASVYDAERGTIIEAIKPVVREVPLESLLARNRYVVVVRPIGKSPQEQRTAIERARSAIGASFDYTGLIGIDNSERFYCSELAAWASQVTELPLVVTPAELYERGEIVYMSGARDDLELQSAALASQVSTTMRVAALGR